MIEAALLFLVTYLMTWPALVAVVICGILAESASNTKTAVAFGILTAIIACVMFSVPAKLIGIGAGAYLLVGLIWSFWRYKRFVAAEVEKLRRRFDKSELTPDRKAAALTDLMPSKNTKLIVQWVVLWPFSFISNVAGDLINVIRSLVTTTFKKVYESIFTAYTKDL